MVISLPDAEVEEDSGYILGTRTLIANEAALAAQWSHMVLVTQVGWEILSLRDSERSLDELTALGDKQSLMTAYKMKGKDAWVPKAGETLMTREDYTNGRFIATKDVDEEGVFVGEDDVEEDGDVVEDHDIVFPP